MRHVILSIGVAVMAGCQAAPVTEPPTPAPVQDTCNAARYASLIGQDATALERVMILGLVRVIRPGQAVTMDFRPERINFMIDEANTITSITCS